MLQPIRLKEVLTVLLLEDTLCLNRFPAMDYPSWLRHKTYLFQEFLSKIVMISMQEVQTFLQWYLYMQPAPTIKEIAHTLEFVEAPPCVRERFFKRSYKAFIADNKRPVYLPTAPQDVVEILDKIIDYFRYGRLIGLKVSKLYEL